MMLRLRRYRALLIVALFLAFSFYHLTQIEKWSGQPIPVEQLKDLGHHVGDLPPSSPPAIVSFAGSVELASQTVNLGSPLLRPSSHTPTPTQTSTLLDYPGALASSDPVWSSQMAQTTAPGGEDLVANKNEKIADEKGESDDLESYGQGRKEIDRQGSVLEKPRWVPQKEHFPVPSSLVIQLPTGQPKRIPPIQHVFGTETPIVKKGNEKRLQVIKEAFKHAWGGYKKYAMPHDELAPLSRDFKDPFNGWGATLVDSLDTLWIMDLKNEFEEAVAEVKKIDFKRSVRKDIPLFETVIRYLGGLIAAHDISSGRYPVLLEKAVELAEILMGAFDTPNRMPVTYYYWAPSYASQPHRAASKVVLAEFGSLSLEFTRLAQMTQDDRYYDAIARITNELEAWQNMTNLPGLWPVSVDASGCKKPDRLSAQMAHSASHGPQNTLPPVQNSPTVAMDRNAADSHQQEPKDLGLPQIQPLDKRQLHSAGILDGEEPARPASDRMKEDSMSSSASHVRNKHSNSTMDDVDCQHQGLASPPFANVERFTMGGMSDSTYEYLPKEWLLLGGLNDQYESMYRHAMEVVRDKLLFRPMTKEGRDILFIGTMRISGPFQGDDRMRSSGTGIEYDGQHLTCFAGGMFALAAKIFGIKDDLEIARRLTDGCVWAYESTTTGIMPEVFHLVPCDDRTKCMWNETKWWETLDPYRSVREEQAKAWYEQQMVLSQEAPVDEEERLGKPVHASTPVLPAGGSKPDLEHGFIKRATSGASMRSEGTLTGFSPPEINEALGAEPEILVKPTQPLSGSPKDRGGDRSKPSPPVFTPKAIASHEEYVQARIKEERLPVGFADIENKKYILRPEAIESVFIMYRVTGDEYWQEQGWKMFTAIQTYTQTEYGNSAITDVTSEVPQFSDDMESFWLAETLKYFYLLYSDPDVVSLDDYVLNTEAHPFKRPK